jgi:hypothetical protein
MPKNRPLTFDNEATLEELAGVGKNRRFDEVIDDDEFEDLQVICKRGTEEIPFAKPSQDRTPRVFRVSYEDHP